MKISVCLLFVVALTLMSFAQRPSVLVLADSSIDTKVMFGKESIDFFFFGYKSIKNEPAKSHFWFRTALTPQCEPLQKPYLSLTTAQITDSVIAKSWNFIRTYDFYISHKTKNYTGIYKSINKAAFYSIE